MKYYLFRHGSTRASTTDNVYHGEEIVTANILDSGIPAINQIGNYLKNQKIGAYFTSPFKRCIQTVERIKSITRKDYVIDERLGEFREDIREPFDKFSLRIKSFLDEISTEKINSVAICTHGAGLSAIKNWLKKGSYKYSDLMDFPASGVLWIIEGKNMEEIDLRS